MIAVDVLDQILPEPITRCANCGCWDAWPCFGGCQRAADEELCSACMATGPLGDDQ